MRKGLFMFFGFRWWERVFVYIPLMRIRVAWSFFFFFLVRAKGMHGIIDFFYLPVLIQMGKGWNCSHLFFSYQLFNCLSHVDFFWVIIMWNVGVVWGKTSLVQIPLWDDRKEKPISSFPLAYMASRPSVIPAHLALGPSRRLWWWHLESGVLIYCINKLVSSVRRQNLLQRAGIAR